MDQLYDLSINSSDGELLSMSTFRGKALLIVNTATQCGLTPQLKELEILHQQFKDQGLEVIGFPCNQFKSQEPVSNEDMADVCASDHGVTFLLTEKIDVNGKNAHPIFKYLKRAKRGFLSSRIKWNFTKFLVDQDGRVIKRYSPIRTPRSLSQDISKILS